MSISNRLQDARVLYDAGRHEGALLSVLVAVAGSSRRRFPQETVSRREASKKMGDGEAFETFLLEEMQRIGVCAVYFNGECRSAEKIFYKWLRNSLAHEAALPKDIVFRPDESDRVARIERDPGPPERLVVTHPVVLLLGHVVSTARENSDIPEAVRGLLHPR